MDHPNTATRTLDAEEDILTYTVSDEAIEAAAGIERSFTLNDPICPAGTLWICEAIVGGGAGARLRADPSAAILSISPCCLVGGTS